MENEIAELKELVQQLLVKMARLEQVILKMQKRDEAQEDSKLIMDMLDRIYKDIRYVRISQISS